MVKRNSLNVVQIFIGAIIVAFFVSVLSGYQIVLAQGVCGGVTTSVINCEGSTSEEAILGIVKDAVSVLTAGVGVVAVGFVIYGAILYSSSAGSSDGLKKAKTIWLNVVISLALFAFMLAITNFLIPGGVFG